MGQDSRSVATTILNIRSMGPRLAFRPAAAGLASACGPRSPRPWVRPESAPAEQVRVVRLGDADAGVPEDLRQLVDIAARLEPPGAERVAQRVRTQRGNLGPRRALGQHLPQSLWVLRPQPTLLVQLFLERGARVRLHRHVTLLPELAGDVHRAARPVDVASAVDAADLVQAVAAR